MVQGGLTAKTLGPHALLEFLAGDHALAMREKIGQNIAHLRFNAAEDTGVPEFIALGVEGIVCKLVLHAHLALLAHTWAHQEAQAASRRLRSGSLSLTSAIIQQISR